MIHAFKPDPVSNRQEAWRFFDFVMHHPEALHMVTWLKSPWGIPATYREMEGSGVNTYKLVNDQGVAHLVKFHWVPKQGVRNLTSPEAEARSRPRTWATPPATSTTPSSAAIIPSGSFASRSCRTTTTRNSSFDPLDDTKRWPEDQFPLLPVGRMVLDRNPDNVFAETEQAAFGTGVLVDGIDFSDDKMLQGRTLSYSDTQRYRVGANYLQLPINAPKVRRAHQPARRPDGVSSSTPAARTRTSTTSRAPWTAWGRRQRPRRDYHQWVEGHLGRYQITRAADDYTQAGERYRTFEDWERDDLVNNLAADMKACPEHIALRMVWHFHHCDEDYGRRVAEGAGIDLQKAIALPPLPGKPAPGQNRSGPTYSDGQAEEASPHAGGSPTQQAAE